ncbi:GLYL3 protein, partial [Crypturellus undulatus]|nr:GLYL3 protein [Crypturellus undulatus]
MLILSCPAQLQRLEGALRRSLPLALPVYGAVMNINRGNPGDFEVVVDTWPDFRAVLARHRGKVAAVGYRERGWGHNPRPTHTRCCPTGAGGRLLHEHACGFLPSPAARRLHPGVRLGSLSPAHADLLNTTWAYGGNARSRHYLVQLLERFPSLCLLDAAAQPVCWSLVDPFGTNTHGYTLPAHRRHGHMQALIVLAARRARARGFPSFG